MMHAEEVEYGKSPACMYAPYIHRHGVSSLVPVMASVPGQRGMFS
jgi:hypothetical protein